MASLWKEKLPVRQIKRLEGDISTDVLVIGGGIVGLLIAYQLQQAGIDCVVADARRIGAGTTGNTTAKITAQHGFIYQQLIEQEGLANAEQYYRINEKALQEYRLLAGTISFHLEERPAFIYSRYNLGTLEAEANAYRQLNIPWFWQDRPPIPFRSLGAVGMQKQLQCHPLELIYSLAEKLRIYEDTFITDIRGRRAIADRGCIRAKIIVIATHFPMLKFAGLYPLKLYQHRSYVIALENGPHLSGMYIDEAQKGFSFRNYEQYLLVGGGAHRTGSKGGGYQALRRLIHRAYPESYERFAWAAQDCMSLDGKPYIGYQQRSKPGLIVASGFNKWGMSGAMVAALVIRDLVGQGRSDYETLFSPQRSMLQPQLLNNIAHSTAVFFALGKRCPHMGCALRWNAAEQSWDCPCHGSRFDKHGRIINNPAMRRLEPDAWI